MKLKFIAAFMIGWLAFPAFAQQTTAITLPGGAVYQTALAHGVTYLEATAGSAIINQKSALNWKHVVITGLGPLTIGALSAGIGGIITMPLGLEKGLSIGHLFYDSEIEGPLSAAAPSGLANIAPVLSVNGSMIATPGSCANNTIFASSVQGVPSAALKAMAKQKAAAGIPIVAPVQISGLTVTYAPQSLAVVKNASGSQIPEFVVIDVLACFPTVSLPAPTITGSVTQTEEMIRPVVRKFVPPPADPMPLISPPMAAPPRLVLDQATLDIPAELDRPVHFVNASFSESYPRKLELATNRKLNFLLDAPGIYLQVAAMSEAAAGELARRLDSFGFEVAEQQIGGGARVLVGPIDGGAGALRATRANLDGLGFSGSAALERIVTVQAAGR